MFFLRLSTISGVYPVHCLWISRTFVDEAFMPVYNFRFILMHTPLFQQSFPQLFFPYFQTETQFYTYPQPLLLLLRITILFIY